jgi:diguanylate cyclase (GGDEF)-like protein/PAS domain S-box-containing protein
MLAATAGTAWWAALDPARLPAAIIGVGAVGGLTIAVSAVRSSGLVRLSWVAVTLACFLWAAALLGSTLGWPGSVTWGVLRGTAFVVVAVGLLTAPGVHRGLRDWGLLLMDGWLVGASGIEVAWVLIGVTGNRSVGLLTELPPALLWAGPDLMAATVVVGLAVRTSSRARGAVSLVALSALEAVSADAVWAATGDLRVGVVLWLIMIGTLACSTLSATPDLWAASRPEAEDLRLARPSHVAVVPGLLAAAAMPHPDVLTVGLAASLLLVLAAQILLGSAETKELWRRTQEQTRRLDTVLTASMDAILRLTPDGVVEYANPVAADVYGWPFEELMGMLITELADPDDLAAHRALVAAGLPEGGLRAVTRQRRADGTFRHVESTISRLDDGGYVLIAREVEERTRLEAELRRQATTDPLTGLLNRQAFLATLERVGVDHGVAVLYLDLDDFKAINDTRGHEAGDELLVRVAGAITAVAGAERTVARLGGDEFAVLVPLTVRHGLGAAEGLAAALVTRLGRDQDVGPAGVSVGVALGLNDHAESILGDADLAMYEAKSAGGGRFELFQPAMRHRIVARSQLRGDLERAIHDGALDIALQPIVDLASGAWAGFEALVRWPDGGRTRPPSESVPLAEETGLIVPLGAWVLGAALDWLAGWPDRAAGVSVNLTGRQVAEPGFADLVRHELERTGVVPDRLTLEITEQTAVEDLGRAGEVLQPLRSLGVHVALDDFGTGFSSLGYLAQLPVDELKIDRKFVSGLGVRSEDDALVRAVLRLASDLGLQVVAEGVETEEQAAALRGYACPFVQGYLYARPESRSTLRPDQCPTPTPEVAPADVPASAPEIPRQTTRTAVTHLP